MQTPAGARSMAHSIGLSSVALATLALLAATPARADDAAAHELLSRMTLSLRSVDYEGSFMQ